MTLLPAVLLLFAQQTFDFRNLGPYDPDVPTPESVLGYGPGDRHTTYREQEMVVQSIAAKSSRVKYFPYGKSVEGKTLRVLAISSEENIARLEEIRANIGKLASGQAEDAEQLQKSTPPIIWINETIHGNEPASFESGMWLLYNLAASNDSRLRGTLSNCVVILNPSYNPDGHERYVVWYNSVAVGNPRSDAFEMREPPILNGRTNHYRFDMNRDRVAMSQDETRQEVAEFLRWNPQVYVDQHGQVETYFFPPVAQSVNENVGRDRYNRWTDIFGRATASAFDSNGWSYFVKDTFDFFYPGYLDTWTSLSGAIGMTHETDGGPPRVRERNDGSLLTLRDGMAKHFTSALAVIGASASRRYDLLKSFAEFKANAASGANLGDRRYLVAKGPLAYKLGERLSRAGISWYVCAPGKRHGRNIFTGDPEAFGVATGEQGIAVDLAQPQGALARALLDPETNFEPEFVEEQLRRRAQQLSSEQYPGADPLEFYDLTAWNDVAAMNLEGWWADGKPEAVEAVSKVSTATVPAATVGWTLPATTEGLLAAARLLANGVRVQVFLKPMDLGGSRYQAGTLMVPIQRNDDNVREKLQGEAQFLSPLNTSYPDEGRDGPGLAAASLRKPDIGVVFGDTASPTRFGGPWFVMEQEFSLPFTPLHSSVLGGDLSKYSAIIFPAGRYGPPSDSLKEWVKAGGIAIILGGSWAIGEKGFIKFEESKLDDDAEPGELPGTLFRANLDSRSFMSWGYDRNDVIVPVSGSTFYKAKPEGGGVVTFDADPNVQKLVSGWEWPDDTEKALANTVWLHDEPVGDGHVIFFAEDPTDRALWPGLYRLLLNALILGPRS